MLINSTSGSGSVSARQVTAVDDTDPLNLITKFTLTSVRGWSNNTCYVDRAYWGCIWCSDLAGTGYFIGSAVNSTTQQIVTSSDGITWTLRNTPVGFDGLGFMAYSPSLKRVVVCAGSSGVIYSDDAINWTGVPNLSLQSMNVIAWSSTLNQFLCLGNSSSYNYNISILNTFHTYFHLKYKLDNTLNHTYYNRIYNHYRFFVHKNCILFQFRFLHNINR